MLILLAVFCSLRWGELAALPRYCVDTDAGIISVRVSVVELAVDRSSPADQVGRWQPRRDHTAVPASRRDRASRGLHRPRPPALVFTGPQGAQLRRGNFTRAWSRATAAAGLSGFHFHDYADTCVMPTWGGSACSAVVSGLKVSA